MVAFPTVPSTIELSPSTATHAPTGFPKRQVAGVALTCRVWPLPSPQTRCCTTTTVMSTGYCELPNAECPREYDLGPCSQPTHRGGPDWDKVVIAVVVTVVVAAIIGLLAWTMCRARSTAPKARAEHLAHGNAAQDGPPQQPQRQQRSRRQEAGAEAIAVQQPAPPNPGLNPPAAPQIVPAQDPPVVAGEDHAHNATTHPVADDGQDNWAHLPFPPGAWIE